MKSRLFTILTIFYVIVIIGIITGFRTMVLNPITFTKLIQNPEQTMEKYKNIWKDETIKIETFTPKQYKSGEIVATITIPKMEYYEMPIYYGATDKNTNWQITTPGYEGNWEMFGEKGRAAVGTHNYQLFTNLPSLQEGDRFIIENENDIYIYKVIGTRIYDDTNDNWEQVAYQDSLLYSVTLMTCYPVEQRAAATKDMYLVYTQLQRGTIYQ